MGKIWLACCSCTGYPRIQREIEARDSGAQVLRVSDGPALERMVEAFVRSSGTVSVAARSSGEGELLGAVEQLVHRDGVRQVIVMVDALDPGLIAQLFHAGVTEVIAGDDEPPTDSRYRECPETGHDGCEGSSAPPRDDVPPAWGANEAAGSSVPGALGTGAARNVARATNPYAEDLDEPDAWVGAQATALNDGTEAAAATATPGGRMPSGGAPSDEPSQGATGELPVGATSSKNSAPAPQAYEEAASVPTQSGAAVAASVSGAAVSASAVSDSAATWPERVAPPGYAPVPRTDTPARGGDGQRARLITLIAGRGGCGKTTLAAAMALRAAGLGLRTAVLDLDLMFGNLYMLLGVEELHDASTLESAVQRGSLQEADIVRASMRVAPGLTLWGPVQLPEHAELMGTPVERLIEVMRDEADLIIADTSTYWGDAVAAAVATCDRCLVLGDARPGSIAAAERAIDLASRIGVARTRMASVFNRFSPRDASEDAAARFEFTTALGLKGRIADGGAELVGFAELGHLDTAMEQSSAFRTSVYELTEVLLRELGCSIVSDVEASSASTQEERPRLRLPWKRRGGEAA